MIAELAIRIEHIVEALKKQTELIIGLEEGDRQHLAKEHKKIDEEQTRTKTIIWLTGVAIGALWVIVAGTAVAVIVAWLKIR